MHRSGAAGLELPETKSHFPREPLHNMPWPGCHGMPSNLQPSAIPTSLKAAISFGHSAVVAVGGVVPAERGPRLCRQCIPGSILPRIYCLEAFQGHKMNIYMI